MILPYIVTFVGDHFTTTTVVEISDDDYATDGQEIDEDFRESVAIDLATNLLRDYYGWDMNSLSTIDIEARRG